MPGDADNPFRFTLQPSRAELVIILASHGAAAASLAMAAIPGWFCVMLGALVGANGWRAIRCWKQPGIRHLYLSTSGVQIMQSQCRRDCLPPQLLYRSEFLLRLRFRAADERTKPRSWDLLLFADAMPAPQWRRLQRVLRFDLAPPAGRDI